MLPLLQDKRNLGEVIQMCRQIKARQLSMQSDTNSLLLYPEYIVPYLVHALAHHTMCPSFDKGMDVKVLEPIYRYVFCEDDVSSNCCFLFGTLQFNTFF